MTCFTDYKGLKVLDASHQPTGEAGEALQEIFIHVADALENLESNIGQLEGTVSAMQFQVDNLQLNDLLDVSTSAPQQGQALVYSAGNWQNKAIELDELGDVSASAPQQGSVLLYSAGWVSSFLNLDQLGDVSASAPQDGSVLLYSAGWVSSFLNLDQLGDVSADPPATGDSLRFDPVDNWKSRPGARLSTVAKDSNYTIDKWDCVVLVHNSSGTVNITLPSSPTDGDNYYIKRIGSGNVTILGTVDGQSNPNLALNDCFHVVYHAAASGWFRL